jgi:hypothetical protein
VNRYVPTTSWWTHDRNGNWKDSGGSPIATVPMQGDFKRVPEIIAKEAYKEYADQGHGSQSFARLHERGGFSAGEIIMFLYERIKRLNAEGKT